MGIEKPFDIAKNNAGDMFVTGVGNSAVAVLHPDGSPAANSPITGGGLQRPLGIAADSGGNMWVANSGLVDIPCPQRADATSPGGSITSISSNGQLLSPTAFTGGGLTLPWGIAVDGNDNVWVANFAGKRLSEFCGLKPANCPPGSSPGDAISPNAGYSFDGLVRNTGVAIDPSGNVWVANNWKEVPPEANPGGYEMVVFVGAAGPVKRPAPRTRPAVAAPRFTG
jgi:streptogramin lyase